MKKQKEGNTTILYIIIAILAIALGFAILNGIMEEREPEEEIMEEDVLEEGPELMDPDIERLEE